MFSPRPAPFWARDDALTYRVMIFTTSGGRMPARKKLLRQLGWKEVFMPFSDFGGRDGHDIMAILFCASTEAVRFNLPSTTFASTDCSASRRERQH
jgi:hypothetical protein